MSTMATIRIIDVVDSYIQNMALYFVYVDCSLIYLTLTGYRAKFIGLFSKSWQSISEVGGPHFMFHFWQKRVMILTWVEV